MGKRYRIASIAVLVTQIVIVVTGGAVRLTGSGLGCDTWPYCTEGSFAPTPELGIHGIIEFANRVMGGVVLATALVMFVFALLARRSRSDVFIASLLVVLLTIVQALIGAVVVWMHLRPDTVGIHFVLSIVLVAISTLLVWRVWFGRKGATKLGSPIQRILTHAASGLFAITVFVGILTTGSGPHAGDGGVARNGLDSVLLQHFHSWPAYALFAVVLVQMILAFRDGPRRHKWASLGFVIVLVAQIAVGLIQANTGLPVLLVGIHMFLSCIATVACASTVLSLRGSSENRDSVIRTAHPVDTQTPLRSGA
ncbi:COX15/CtaA family protein [Humidisolicoccus flavus]|uniref:COX15/CtaA family protein n=1 Tax=Humidisolicoccus flavus TaxID=3111414 RepID=UPI0032564081